MYRLKSVFDSTPSKRCKRAIDSWCIKATVGKAKTDAKKGFGASRFVGDVWTTCCCFPPDFLPVALAGALGAVWLVLLFIEIEIVPGSLAIGRGDGTEIMPVTTPGTCNVSMLALMMWLWFVSLGV